MCAFGNISCHEDAQYLLAGFAHGSATKTEHPVMTEVTTPCPKFPLRKRLAAEDPRDRPLIDREHLIGECCQLVEGREMRNILLHRFGVRILIQACFRRIREKEAAAHVEYGDSVLHRLQGGS